MRLTSVSVLLCALGWVAGQDAYTQGVVNGATLALAGTAVVGLGAIAIKQHQNRNRFRNRYRYNPYNNYYGGYNQQYYYPQQPYYYRRRRAAAVAEPNDVELDFEKVMAQDRGQCGMRVVCELEARSAAGAEISRFGRLIVSLFGPSPAPVPAAALDTAHGRYGYAAYVGAQSGLESCARLYSSCQFDSETVLKRVQESQQTEKAAV